MDVSKDHGQRHSAEDFAKQFSVYTDSGAGVIHVRTREVLRAAYEVRKQALADNGKVMQWDVVDGFKEYNTQNVWDALVPGDGNVDIMAAFATPLNQLRQNRDAAPDSSYFVFLNPHPYMENNPSLAHMLLLYSQVLPSTPYVVVLITPDAPLPDMAGAHILSIEFTPPGLGELQESFNGIVSNISDDSVSTEFTEDEIEQVCYTGAGMTAAQFEMYASLALVKAVRDGHEVVSAEDVISGVSLGKTDVVKSTDILELYPTANMSDVGGLENLKEWVSMRKGCYSDEAKEFGIQPPKGIVLVGVPGSGKSLIAKSIAKEFGVPLIRLDFGRVFNSLLGASEQRMRTALAQAEAMAPCVIFADEIDKGLGGAGGSGDSGASSRVLGSFLTWLQECQAPVFTMVTANNVTGLPPELMRRGRFDAIFSTSLPSKAERREVLRIHLAMRHRDIADFPKKEVESIVSLCEGYVPAEIESAVKDALVLAFSAGEEMTMEHVRTAFKAMVPLSKAFAPQIEAMNAWAKANATPASLPDTPEEVAVERAPVRRTSPRRGVH